MGILGSYAALEHHWYPDAIFLIFTAYFDESDTHGPAPDLILAAFLGTSRQWQLFERRLKGLQRRDGFKVFHAKDFKSRHGEFEDWSNAKGTRLVGDLAKLVRDGLTEGLTVTLPRAQYEAEYRAPPIPKGMNLDSQYGVCFRVCLDRLIAIIGRDQKPHKLHIVIEDGHKNVGDTRRIFNDLKKRHEELGFPPLLGTITIAKKSECLPLMVADFQAHLSSINEGLKRAGEPSYIELTESAKLPKKNEAGLTFIAFPPNSLRQMKNLWEQEKQARIDRWRAARDSGRALVACLSKEKSS